ncbi:hypothetical protein IFR05_014955 [Cadophora sp. M221]|nr:hypothetical protein IFR05_014955 [Cadophora sp. M221]
MPNVQSLYLATNSFYFTRQDDKVPARHLSQLVNIVRRCVLVLPQLSKFTLEMPKETAVLRIIGNRPVEYLEIPIRPINDALGFMHQWIDCDRRPQINVAVVWDAGRSGMLTWTDHQYWKSVPLANMGLFFNTASPSTRSVVRWTKRLSFVGLNPRMLPARGPEQDSRYKILSLLYGHNLAGDSVHDRLPFENSKAKSE